MQKKNYSVNVQWDSRYPKKGTNLCPVQLGFYLNGKQFKVGLQLYATKQDYEKAVSGKGGSDEVKALRMAINKYMIKAEAILDRVPNVSKESLIKLFKSEADLFVTDKTDLYGLMQARIDDLLKTGRIKTAHTGLSAIKSWKKYKKEMFLEDMTAETLQGYKDFMINSGNSITTAQMYLRDVRTVFNQAIKNGIVSEKLYPFKHFTIGTSGRSNSVLYPEQLKALWEYKPDGLVEERAKDMFFLCYFMNGANFKDVAYLKFKNIKGEMLGFVREKTKRTTRVAAKEIMVYINSEMQKIFDKWARKTGKPDDYYLTVLDGCHTPIEKEIRRLNFMRNHNRALNAIGEKLGFKVRLCLNLARHSMATRLKIGGVQTSVIADLMGHTDIKTTMAYLKSLPNEMIKDISESLLKF